MPKKHSIRYICNAIKNAFYFYKTKMDANRITQLYSLMSSNVIQVRFEKNLIN